jgi:hypothetical protein
MKPTGDHDREELKTIRNLGSAIVRLVCIVAAGLGIVNWVNSGILLRIGV